MLSSRSIRGVPRRCVAKAIGTGLGRSDAGVVVLGVVLMRSAGHRTLAEVGASVRGRRQPLRHRDDDPTNAEGLLGALLLTNPACTSRRIFFYLRWISTLASPT